MSDVSSPAIRFQPVACRLRHAQVVGREGYSRLAGEVELENVSPDPVEIDVAMHPLERLEFTLAHAAVGPIPLVPCGDHFSPRRIPYVLRLEPGEKYTHPVSLFGGLPEEKRIPGTYTVTAVYRTEGFRAASEPLEVTV